MLDAPPNVAILWNDVRAAGSPPLEWWFEISLRVATPAQRDGVLSRIEVIKACRADERVRELLGLPRVIRQEDGTRDAFEAVFQVRVPLRPGAPLFARPAPWLSCRLFAACVCRPAVRCRRLEGDHARRVLPLWASNP